MILQGVILFLTLCSRNYRLSLLFTKCSQCPSLISSLFPQLKLWLSCNGLTIHELNRICLKKTMHDTHTTSQLWLCKPNRQLLVVNPHTHRPEQSSNGYPSSISLYVLQWSSSSASDVSAVHCVRIHAAHLGQVHSLVRTPQFFLLLLSKPRSLLVEFTSHKTHSLYTIITLNIIVSWVSFTSDACPDGIFPYIFSCVGSVSEKIFFSEQDS